MATTSAFDGSSTCRGTDGETAASCLPKLGGAASETVLERSADVSTRRLRPGFGARLSYASRVLPSCLWARVARRAPAGPVHLIIAIADHFEPAIVPEDGRKRASYAEQKRRLERWCVEYPRLVDSYRDSDGHQLKHTYFYAAEQNDKELIQRLATHCHEGWGEIEIHLHHGESSPDTAENTRATLVAFRDALEREGCLAYLDGTGGPRYAFVHGDFALANSAAGRYCGVDSEMQVLADSGCYADMTLPTGRFHRAQTAKINSLYECGQPLNQRAPHRRGRNLKVGRSLERFPVIVQGPLMVEIGGGRGLIRIDNGALTAGTPPSLQRLQLWKQAAIAVEGRPDWIFVKLHCHSMDPWQESAVLGETVRNFLRDVVTGAKERGETIHFASAREMVNIAMACCDGREGNPGQYRDYRLKRVQDSIAGRRTGDAQAKVSLTQG